MVYYLDPLPEPKPGGRPNLLADWDGLSQETQLLILDELRQDPGPAYLYRCLLKKAAEGRYPYISYLAAEELLYLAERESVQGGEGPEVVPERHRH